MSSKNCSYIGIFQSKKFENDLDDFGHRKLTFKVKFWHLLTAHHYSNSPQLVISFDYSWCLAKNLSNFVSLHWKLNNRYCHTLYEFLIFFTRPLSTDRRNAPLKVIFGHEGCCFCTNFLIKMYDANPFESAHCLMASMITVIPVAPGGAALLVPLKVG